METIRNLVVFTGGQAPGRPQPWHIESHVLRNEQLTATDRSVFVHFRIKARAHTQMKMKRMLSFTAESAHL